MLSITIFFLLPFSNYSVHDLFLKTSLTGQCKMQTADYCFYYANEYVTTLVPLFSNP